ncbi:Vacuolar protein-sorting-associated protein 28 [Lignoscripta atroalba]|nr:Vacuolar protein-sorting-associated protein 28 [Lignoscripta atroalba]
MYSSPRPLSYAPTPYSYTPNTSLSATINLDEEVKLSTNSTERDLYDSLAEIYSIIITLDGLERAYIKDSITELEYTETCSRLLKQYASNLSDESVAREFIDLETFKRTWGMECPRATERLRVGLPATISHPTPTANASHASSSTSYPPHLTSTSSAYPHHLVPTNSSTNQQPHPSTNTPSSGSLILLATENFITFLDALKLGLLSKDQLHPLLSEVIQSVNKVTDRDFEGRGKIISWLIRLNGMRAQEELGEGEARELMFEMDGAYAGFKATLS